jgi:hypothetical protein
MSERSTLIYLVHQIKEEMKRSVHFQDMESDEQECWDSYSPSGDSVRNILDFERLLQVEETESVGMVEWILN